ncbi:MAG: zinc ribbon domain-containing protein [Gudongella sp.]|nr:zinc ribbon domain-containing protein [Gudongella sp.]
MAFFDKLGDIAKNLGDKTGDAIETTKLNSEISSKKREVAQLKQKVGIIYYDKYKMGEAEDPEALEFFAEIDKLMVELNELQMEVDKIKGQNESKPVVPTSAVEGVKCPSCGTINDTEKKFCSECGTKLQQEAPQVRYCGSCGAEVEEGLKFCGECGAKVEEEPLP